MGETYVMSLDRVGLARWQWKVRRRVGSKFEDVAEGRCARRGCARRKAERAACKASGAKSIEWLVVTTNGHSMELEATV